MARGSSADDSNLKLFFGKITGLKEGEKVHIKLAEAIGDKKTRELDELCTKLSGKLTNVQIKEREWKGENIVNLTFTLKDVLGGEMYMVSVGINHLGRSIINTILGLKKPYGEFEIRVWNGKDGFPRATILHNDEKTGWKYTIEELKKYVVENTVKKKGVTVVERDYFELDKFLLDDLRTNVIVNFDKTPSKFADKQPVEVPAGDDGATDDLPF